MDPDANLAEQLTIARNLQQMVDDDRQESIEYREDAARLADLVIALNTWISGGGFLPAPWHNHPLLTQLADALPCRTCGASYCHEHPRQ